ncbi:DUF4383 domain-containing protein [Saccharopolyspora sp. NPDC002578]
MAATGTRQRVHPVHVVHRVGAGALGLGLWVFAGLGFAHGLSYFSTSGQPVLGLSSNGLLSTISLVAGCLLISAALWKGPAASTATAVLGCVFVLSGLAHLAILNTPFNYLAFGMPNVVFSLIAGLVLLILGSYGRVTGDLPLGNPYRVDRGAVVSLDVSSTPGAREQEMVDAELAMAEGNPTRDQEALVRSEQTRLRAIERARLNDRARRDEPEEK